MATHIRCYDCGAFFSIKHPACDECEAPRRTKNGHLEVAKLNDHLYGMAERADTQRKAEAHIRAGGQLNGEPPKWAKQRAKQLMDHL